MENNENNYMFGAISSPYDVRDYKLSVAMAGSFPEKFELKPTRIKNQGAVGSCVAHALAEVVEYYEREQENRTTSFSTGYIYGNRRNSTHKASGMIVRNALSNMCKFGDVPKESFTENIEVPLAITLFEKRADKLQDAAYPNRFTSYFRLYKDDEIKHALMNYGPVVFAMNWYKDLKVNSDGVITTTQDMKKYSGGHCMVIYGWNETGWLIQNSWGTSWGKSGRAVLPYGIKKSEVWGVTDTVVGEHGDIIKPEYDTTFKRFIAKIINWFGNLFRKNV